MLTLVLSFWNNMSTPHKKSHGIVVSFSHAIHLLDWFKCLQKKKKFLSISVCNGQGRRSQKQTNRRVIRTLTSTKTNGWKSWKNSQVLNATHPFPHQHQVQAEEPHADLESENTEIFFFNLVFFFLFHIFIYI